MQYQGSGDGAAFDDIPTLKMLQVTANMRAYSYRGYRIASGFAANNDYSGSISFTAVARYDGISNDPIIVGIFCSFLQDGSLHEEEFYKNSKLVHICLL